MKYKFEVIDNDTTKLIYKDKEFKIKRKENNFLKGKSIVLN